MGAAVTNQVWIEDSVFHDQDSLKTKPKTRMSVSRRLYRDDWDQDSGLENFNLDCDPSDQSVLDCPPDEARSTCGYDW